MNPVFAGWASALLFISPAGCKDDASAPAAPRVELTGRVVDQANILSSAAESRLTAQLVELEEATSDQLVVATVSSLQGQSIEAFALGLGRDWKIGRADLDNGVLLVIAPADRRVRVEVGYGLEALLTDQRAAQSIERMMPSLRQSNFDEAVSIGVDDIAGLLKSDRQRPRYLNEERRKLAA